MKNIVIVGGGTAGWITALYCKKFYPEFDATVVASEEIGILGAGEGTTPHFITEMAELDIDIDELMRACSATYKFGINFVNWNGDDKSYFHEFDSRPDLKIDSYNKNLYALEHLRSGNVDQLSFMHKLVEAKKSHIQYGSRERLGNAALHFNAVLLAQYLKKISLERGVKYIDDRVVDIKTNIDEEIVALELKNTPALSVDFVFDCSGFARILIGNHFKSEWKSYSDVLPMDSAIPFFLPHDGDISPKTDAIAMKNGWAWKIPTQERYGCGYVFSSRYCTIEEAVAEIEDMFEVKIDSPRCIKFSAGAYEKVYIKNCLSAGLSQGFVEPLEATSIFALLNTLKLFFHQDGLLNKSPYIHDYINEQCYEYNENIKNFICLHYITKRSDSLFWQDFKTNYPVPEDVIRRVSLLNHNSSTLVDEKCFSTLSYLAVCYGLEVFDKNIIREKIEDRINIWHEGNIFSEISRTHREYVKSCIPLQECREY